MKTREQKDHEYNNKLLELVEKKKLKMLTQDQYDKQHTALVEEVYGVRAKDEEK